MNNVDLMLVKKGWEIGKKPLKTVIEIYWEHATPHLDEVQDLAMTMGLCGFFRVSNSDSNGPDLWIREKAGVVNSWKWLELLAQQYRAKNVLIRPEYVGH